MHPPTIPTVQIKGISSKFFLDVSALSAAALTSNIEILDKVMIIGKIMDNRRYTWFFRKKITPNSFSNTYYMIRDNII
jgi:hypothetical protein